MIIFLDTEFIERPSTIELVSIGMVAEDGRELYLENAEADLTHADEWIKTNVLAHLLGGDCCVSRLEIRQKILDFIGKDIEPEFWAYYADYDWVVFCWIFGRMIDLPEYFPKYCRDFKQTMDTFGIKKSNLPEQTGTEHHALADARWLAEAFYTIATRTVRKVEDPEWLLQRIAREKDLQEKISKLRVELDSHQSELKKLQDDQ